MPSDCPFLDTCDTCEETNEDEQDLKDLFEDVKIREMMAKYLSERVRCITSISIIHIFQVAFSKFILHL